MSSAILSLGPTQIEKVKGEINNRVILITGGTGSFGSHLMRTLLTDFNPAKVVVFSRDELKQSVLRDELYSSPEKQFGRTSQNMDQILRFFLGDVRDFDRLMEAFSGVDVIIHASALKQVPALEYNPFEAIKTNVMGANNVIRAAVGCGVKKMIALSTDKAAAPVNLYGATKLCQDKLMVAANHMYQKTRIGVVRYGNVFASRGSVVPVFLKQAQLGTVTITDERMTRFTISLAEGVSFSLNCLSALKGGEIFIPKLASYRITTVANVFAKKYGASVTTVGIRPGEKLHEVMVPRDEALNTVEFSEYFVIMPAFESFKFHRQALLAEGATLCKHGFEYESSGNDNFISEDGIVAQLSEICR